MAEVEADWRSRLPEGDFDHACRILDRLLADLVTPAPTASAERE